MLFTQAEVEAHPAMGSTVDPDAFTVVHDYVAALVVLEGGAPYVSLEGDNLAAVRGVAIAVAVRELSNPQRFEFEQIGSYSYRLAPGAAAGLLTTAERYTIRRAYGRAPSGYTVPMVSPADTGYPYVAPA